MLVRKNEIHITLSPNDSLTRQNESTITAVNIQRYDRMLCVKHIRELFSLYRFSMHFILAKRASLCFTVLRAPGAAFP